jgi:glutathione S-transferase
MTPCWSNSMQLNESGGLVQYLLETYDPTHTLHPAPGTTTRPDFLKLLHFGPATAYHIGVPILFPGPDLEEKKKQWHDIVAVTLEQSLTKYGGPYLLGDQFTAVDASIAYDLVTVAAAGDRAKELWESHPALVTYHALLQERPAYKMTFPPTSPEGK